MDDQEIDIPRYPVRVWEFLLILLGAIGLVAAGGAGLGIKILNNTFNPDRAEAIANSFIDYQIPGGSEGVFGVTIGGAKLVRIRSATNPPDVVLLVGETPVKKETDETEEHPELDENLEATPSDQEADKDFTATSSQTENRKFCNQTIPITIEQGELTSSSQPAPIAAIRYTAKATDELRELVVVLTVSGNNARPKADTVFNSLRCK